ncbi:Chalcone synthase-like protein [Drosera capensis]
MVSIEVVCKAQSDVGPAIILAIGTATPQNCFYQDDFPDMYFRATNREHMTDLKDKLKLICEKSMINKRDDQGEPIDLQLQCTIDLALDATPKLGKEAAAKAIKEWGQPISTITHLIFCTTTGVDLPGSDYQLTKLLGLQPSVNRFMINQQGCFPGGTVLRLAKDIAENNKRARILAVCSELISIFLRGPSEDHFDSLVGQSLFGDASAAMIIGSDPIEHAEKPVFQLLSASQTLIPDSERAMGVHMGEEGLTFDLSRDVPSLISRNTESILVNVLGPIGIKDWNSIFWVAHPGGRVILDWIESKFGLQEDEAICQQARSEGVES